MSETPSVRTLQLPDLRIRAFRAIGELAIPRLGRVTLIAGRNGVGKTTVLDAVRLYAARGHYLALAKLVERREGLPSPPDGRDRAPGPLDFGTLFHGRDGGRAKIIRIGPFDSAQALRIEARPRTQAFSSAAAAALSPSGAHRLKVSFREKTDTLLTGEFNEGYLGNPSLLKHVDFDNRLDFPPSARCEAMGPESLTAEDAARLWDNIALTEQEDHAISALNLVLAQEVTRVAMLGGGRGSHGDRRIAVRLRNHDKPVSLRSLGDGAVRLFGIALALANAGDGFFVIDEAENGIHHTDQRGLWEMVLRAAHRNGAQVLATTHSWDSVRGFAAATTASDELDGVLVRLEGVDGRLRAVEYGTDDLAVAAEQGIEVR